MMKIIPTPNQKARGVHDLNESGPALYRLATVFLLAKI